MEPSRTEKIGTTAQLFDGGTLTLGWTRTPAKGRAAAPLHLPSSSGRHEWRLPLRSGTKREMGRGRQRKEVETEGSRRQRELWRGRALTVTGDHHSRRLRLREKVEGNEPRVGGEAAGREILFS
jgi:hypothetical protein